MSNILIIKHGSLGDIAQISGAIQDIKENHQNDKIYILTTPPYEDLLKKCPFLDEILIDKRLSRLNLFYLFKLKKKLNDLNFSKIFDLQNSSRTSFYRKYILRNQTWFSTETTLPSDKTKEDFDEDSVLERFDYQLSSSGVLTRNTLHPDFSWACENIEDLKFKYNLKKYILLFPFCSPSLPHKKWPHFNQLINLIKERYSNIKIIVAPGPLEINDSKEIDAQIILENNKAIKITQLAGLIKCSSFVISNDTGPAHMAAHLGSKGITLFGRHTTPHKVSIETDNFKAIVNKDLKNLSATEVYEKIINNLDLIH
tara:strand:- start:566 stop:1504 length:939 start_codon:yes stop_codon:yes gene_type:complete